MRQSLASDSPLKTDGDIIYTYSQAILTPGLHTTTHLLPQFILILVGLPSNGNDVESGGQDIGLIIIGSLYRRNFR